MQKMIIAVKLNERKENSAKFQEVISNYGDIIKFRVGISGEEQKGLIMLCAEAENKVINNLTDDLKLINELSMNIMEAPV
ncbi:MAG: hypothetical protein A2Y24_06565 [Clostridiales bacterium GWE2_32_10]|nr:MAG: hypothetical protein A2Y24_06565 [Clostridiales bacterium GWE2_32_10]HBY20392.1 hypothetical protein [Clostridiales bacterium]